MTASHTAPSQSSPSPTSTMTRASLPRTRSPRALPQPTPGPCPREPFTVSKIPVPGEGIAVSGLPSSPIFAHSPDGRIPRSSRIGYRQTDPCPLLGITRSRSDASGSDNQRFTHISQGLEVNLLFPSTKLSFSSSKTKSAREISLCRSEQNNFRDTSPNPHTDGRKILQKKRPEYWIFKINPYICTNDCVDLQI